jgi:molecular chaperone HtpG
MQALQGIGMDAFPDSFNVVVNTNHPLVAQKLLQIEEGSNRDKFSAYLLHLALVQQGMLRGEALSNFVAETLETLR